MIFRRRRIFGLALVGISAALLLGLAASWYVAGALIAPAPRVIGTPPPDLNVTAFTVKSESGSTISGWHTRPESSGGVIVLLHGIRGSRLVMLDRARMFHSAGYATVLIDFQAHGESPGTAITVGYLEKHDVRAAIEFARHEHPHEPIGVLGVSLGGAAAILASPPKIDALVIESVYPNVRDAIHNRVAASLGPFSSIPTELLLFQMKPRLGVSPDELRPIAHLPNIGCPVFVASGRVDRHTTAAETQILFEAARDPKELWLVDGVAHVDLYEAEPIEYRNRILGFFNHYLRGDRQDAGIPSPTLEPR